MSPKHLEKDVRTQEGNSKLFPRPFTGKWVSGGFEILILLIIRVEFKGKEFTCGLTNLLVEKNLTRKPLQVH